MDTQLSPLKWLSPDRSPFVLEGFPFLEKEGVYRRLSLNPPKPLPPSVEELANCTAGGQIRFHGVFQKLVIRARLTSGLTMDHFAATGQCGFDCYLSKDTTPPRYYGTTRLDFTKDQYEAAVVELTQPMELEVIVNFPLYTGVSQVLLGFDPAAELSPPQPRQDDRRIVVYGTSITQGGCASRPGMLFTNILSRRLNREFVNLGFSGSGKCEPELALAIREIERTALLIVDTDANCPDEKWIAEKYPAFLRLYRERYPKIPILLLSRPPFAKDLIQEEMLQKRQAKRDIIQQVVAQRVDAGDKNIYFLDGELLYDPEDFEEYTVDGVHATDLGFYQMADHLFPFLCEILKD